MYTDGILYIWAGKHYRALFWEMRKKKSDRERTKKKKKKKIWCEIIITETSLELFLTTFNTLLRVHTIKGSAKNSRIERKKLEDRNGRTKIY